MFRRGFKTEAKKIALETRTEMHLGIFDPLDPYELAELYGLEVHDLSSPDLPAEAVQHFTTLQTTVFSAALVPIGDYRNIIIENHTHDPLRRRSTMAHEMAHVLLEHEFGLLLADENGCRSSKSAVEEEAAELSGELLIPADSAKRAALNDWNDDQVADRFQVSVPMARWRMNSTGARKIAARTHKKWNR